MRNREIAVAFYDLVIASSTRTPGIEAPSCANIDDVLQAMRGLVKLRDKPRFNQRKNTVLIEVMDWQHDAQRNEHHLLVNRADQDLPDVAFKDFSTRQTRFAGKTKVEGIDVSTHMILRPNADGRSALLLVTQGAGMGIAVIEPLFGALAKLVADTQPSPHLFEFSHPSGETAATYKVRYAFKCDGHKGATLARDLALGQLLDMELISYQARKFDSGGNLLVENTSITLRPTMSFSGTLRNIKSAIRDGLSGNNTPYEAVRIRFKDHSDKPRAETFALNALDEAFVKREYLSFPTDIQSNYKRLSRDIIGLMQGLT